MGRHILPEDLRKNAVSIREEANNSKNKDEIEVIAESLEVAAYMLERYDSISNKG